MIGSEFDFLFSECVFNIFFESIQRSIDYARANPGEEGILVASLGKDGQVDGHYLGHSQMTNKE